MPITIMVYTTPKCPNCVTVKSMLKMNGFEFQMKELDEDGMAAFATLYGVRQMPQVFINNLRIGGVDGLKAALASLPPRITP
jgi:glutaredoxin 3